MLNNNSVSNNKVLYANPQSREALKAKVREIFNLFDADGSGEIDAKEFHELIFAMGEIMTEEEVQKYLAVLDKDGNGSISFDEFFEWWGKKETNAKNYSTDKLKEIKTKLQSANLMRSVTYLMKKAKENLQTEKQALKSSSSAVVAPPTNNASSIAPSSNPDSFAADVGVEIGQLNPDNAKIHARVSYDTHSDSKNKARFELLLQDGASAQEVEKIKNLFMLINTMMGNTLYETSHFEHTSINGKPGFVAEFTFSNESPFAKQGAGMIQSADLSKLQFDLLLSQSLDEIDLKELALRFGIRIEISAATINMLTKTNPLVRSFNFLSALRNVVFQLRFATLEEAAEKMTAKSIQGKMKLKKDDMARKVQGMIKTFSDDYKLPIKEISKINIQVENHGFTLQFTGLDVSFLFEEVPEPTFLDQFTDVAPASASEWTFNYFAPRGEKSERFTGKVDVNGHEQEVVIVKTKHDDLELCKETSDRLNEIYNELNNFGGEPLMIDFFKSAVSNGYVYEARTVHPTWKPLRQWLEEERMIDGPINRRRHFADIENQMRKLVLHLFDFGQRMAWNFVTHGPTIDQFIINPITEEIKCIDWLDLRKKPSTTVPGTANMFDMPPETFTTVGAFNNEEQFDVWCMGVCLYRLFTGANVDVFVGGSADEIIQKIISGEFNKDAHEYKNLPETVRELVEKLLVVDKEQRMSLFFYRSFDKWLNPENTEN